MGSGRRAGDGARKGGIVGSAVAPVRAQRRGGLAHPRRVQRPPPTADLDPLLGLVRARRAAAPPGRALVVGLSGIDGSGKTVLARALAERLTESGLRVALLHADDWLDPGLARPGARVTPAAFARGAVRWDELFARAVEPLRATRSLRLDLRATRPDGSRVIRRLRFRDVDVVVLEGVFLLRRGLRRRLDVRAWIDCAWDAALARALRRAQEGLSQAATRRAYRTLYFPAQRLHLRRDDPRRAADAVLDNGTARRAPAAVGALRSRPERAAGARAAPAIQASRT